MVMFTVNYSSDITTTMEYKSEYKYMYASNVCAYISTVSFTLKYYLFYKIKLLVLPTGNILDKIMPFTST